MKQLLIVTNANYGTNNTQGDAGVITMRKLSDSSILSAKAEENFSISLGRGKNLVPFIIPEVDVATLKVAKSEGLGDGQFDATITIPDDIEVGADYTVIFVKKGTVFNERNKWTVTYRPIKGDTAETVAQKFADFVNNNPTLNLEADVDGAEVTVTCPVNYEDFNVVPADSLMSDAVTVNPAENRNVDEIYVKDLAQRCVAGKGIKYLAEDGAEIYPGYPENVPVGEYTVYTLRFAVGRDSAKTRDERVSQLVHIAVLSNASVVSKLNTILNTSGAAAASHSVLDEDENA